MRMFTFGPAWRQIVLNSFMPDENNIRRFTALDIEKYHKGLLSAKERHELEKAALDDPFLSDALEGYATEGANVSNDLDELQKRLSGRIEDKKIIPTSSKRHSPFTLWRVAAILVLMAGAAYLTYQFSSRNRSEIAENKILPQKDTKSTDSATQSPAKTNNTEAENKENGISETKDDQTVKDQEVLQSGKSGAGVPSVTMEYQDQQAAAPVKAPSENKDIRTENAASGNERMANAVSDSTLAKENKQESTPAYTESRKQKAQEFGLKKAVPGYEMSFKKEGKAEPLAGWNSYKTYLNNELRFPESMRDKMQQKKVIVSFKIDDNGVPSDLKVERSSCNECEPEMIRVIKEGPKWKPAGNNERTSITVTF